MKKRFCILLAAVMLLTFAACGEDTDKGAIDRDDTQRGNQVGDLCYGGSLTEISEQGVALSTFNPAALKKITVINF